MLDVGCCVEAPTLALERGVGWPKWERERIKIGDSPYFDETQVLVRCGFIQQTWTQSGITMVSRLTVFALFVFLLLTTLGCASRSSNQTTESTAPAVCPKSEEEIKALDTEYQAAVERNDAEEIRRLLPDNFVLVTGKGNVINKAELVAEARSGEIVYERQDDSQQTVRFFGDPGSSPGGTVAVITALLHAKGSEGGQPFEYRLWFSDVYLCTPDGWRYTFAQSSIPLPD